MIDAVAEIKARLNIEDVVQQYVQLKKAGRSFKGLCPFHPEKSPSFIVSPERGMAYCFGCHKGGDVFKFVQEIEGIEFVDALKMLAERAGVVLTEQRDIPKFAKNEKDDLYEIHAEAAQFYCDNLWQTKDGEKVLEYLHHRGLNDDTIKAFGLGFSPDAYDATYPLLMKKGFSKKALLQAGIVLTQETTADKVYDRFRGRLMFPISDQMGRVVGFGGRALKKDQEPKYLNSPETPIYHKSHILYGFSKSKVDIREQKSVVLVEGYMDMIAAFQAGVRNVVASSGTALTLQQLRLLKPYISTLILAFDMDLAGQEAAKRAYDLTHEIEVEVKVLELPEAKDIAEFTQKRPGELQDVLTKSKGYGDYFYGRLFKIYGNDSSVAKRKILSEFFPFLSQLKSSIEKDAYIRRFAHDLKLEEVQIYDEIKHFKLPVNHPARLAGSLDNTLVASTVKKLRSEELLLGFMIEFPRIAGLFLNKISSELFEGDLKAIYNAFCDQYNTVGIGERQAFLVNLPHDLAEKGALLSLYVGEIYGEVSEEACELEMKALLDKLLKNFFANQGKELQRKMIEAERRGDRGMSNLLLQELQAHNLKVFGS